MLKLYHQRRPDRVGGGAGRPVFPEAWLKMASAPAGAEALINRDGWAPAIHLLAPRQPDCHVYTFPGPPNEMQPLFEEQVAPRLAALFPRKSLARRVEVNVHESDVAPVLDQLMATFPGSYLKAYVSLRTPEWLPVDVVVLDEDVERAGEQLNSLLGAFEGLMSGLGEIRLGT
jgi:molybdopterin-biosynthesis enzyme MoeA-like protein